MRSARPFSRIAARQSSTHGPLELDRRHHRHRQDLRRLRRCSDTSELLVTRPTQRHSYAMEHTLLVLENVALARVTEHVAPAPAVTLTDLA